MKPLITTITLAVATAVVLLVWQNHNLAALQLEQQQLTGRHTELRQLVQTLTVSQENPSGPAPEPDPPLTADTIIAQAEASLADNDPTVIPRLTARIKNAPTADLKALVAGMFTEANERRASQATGVLIVALMSELADREPHWIFDFFINHERGGAMIAANILTTIANGAPGTALELFLQNRDRLDNNACRLAVATIAAQLAKTDIPRALNLVDDLEDEQKQAVIRGLVGGAQMAGTVPRLIAALDTHGDPDIKNDALGLLLQHHVAEQGFAALPALSEQYGLDPTSDNRQVMNLAYSQNSDRPAEAADWLLAASHPEHRLSNFASYIGSWAESDYNAAATYLRERDPGPATDHAIAAFAERITPKEPESATDWAKTITDPTLREQTLTNIHYASRPNPK